MLIQSLVRQFNSTNFYDQIEEVVSNINVNNVFTVLGQIIIVIIIFTILNSVATSLINRVQERREIERRVTRQIKVFSKYIIWTIGVLTILGILGIDLTLIATSLGIAGIAVGFAARDLISNLISGVFILIDRTYLVNDAVVIRNTYGIVRLITLRNTEIKTFDGNIVIIPNSQVVSDKIINMTSGSNLMLTSISVNISYDEDSQKVKDLMESSLDGVEGVFAENEIKFRTVELEERLQGTRVEMYFTVEARNEPWIKGNVFEKVIPILVENGIKFHRQAPNDETDYGTD